ncbi:hypothetical protein AVEN_186743-1 [Araneus ventricosus]|uniref:Uncharacterized protein n=1 Tax=Araneus ventricosus TaxID=182803 RepID=A0A4Y2RJM6_ARAVE|nr:hypothetical protein AVEN_186743-1 [Araneus ventricosus]
MAGYGRLRSHPISTRCCTILLQYPHDIVRYSEYRITSWGYRTISCANGAECYVLGFGVGGLEVRKLDSTEDSACICAFAGVGSLEREVPAQVLSSSSDLGSK